MKLSVLLVVAAVFIADIASAQPSGDGSARPPAPMSGGGVQTNQMKDLLQRACASCHGLDLLTNQPRSRDDWTDVVSRMIGNGAQLTDDEYSLLIEYLAMQYGLTKPNAPSRIGSVPGGGTARSN